MQIGSEKGQPAVFLDRDGTIIEDIGHLGSPSQVVFFPDTIEALRLLGSFRLFVVTNQPGVGSGIITLEQLDQVNAFILGHLANNGIKIEQIYYCPHTRSDCCACIKPNPYFLLKAAGHYGLDLTKSFVVGDHPHDVLMARYVGATGIYVLTGHGAKHLAELPNDIFIADGIAGAARIIRELHARPSQ